MRLDARNGDRGWSVWHVEEARAEKRTIWCDDETAQYGVLVWPLQLADGRVVLETKQAKRIVIIPSVKVVLINPIEDGDSTTIAQTQDRLVGA